MQRGDAVEFTVHFEGYIFAGVVRYCVAVAGAGLSGGAAQQRSGGWSWFLRYADGELAGDGLAASWGAMLADMRRTLAMEEKYGRLGYLRRDATP